MLIPSYLNFYPSTCVSWVHLMSMNHNPNSNPKGKRQLNGPHVLAPPEAGWVSFPDWFSWFFPPTNNDFWRFQLDVPFRSQKWRNLQTFQWRCLKMVAWSLMVFKKHQASSSKVAKDLQPTSCLSNTLSHKKTLIYFPLNPGCLVGLNRNPHIGLL